MNSSNVCDGIVLALILTLFGGILLLPEGQQTAQAAAYAVGTCPMNDSTCLAETTFALVFNPPAVEAH